MTRMTRMSSDRKAKKVMNRSPEERTGRGRPRKDMPETIREHLPGLSLTWKDVLNEAEDRDG